MRFTADWLAFPVLAIILLAPQVRGDEPCCCAHCGCHASCQKVCRLVCEEKKVEVACFGCLCEPFCVPGPSCPTCQHCECVCASCDTKGDGKTPYARAKPFVWSEWIPSKCATIFNRKKLMKKNETVTVKSYRWVVEDLCASCDGKTVGADIGPDSQIPAPPIANIPRKVGVFTE